ncbi:MAG TPA: triose-phosphate isomerase [Eubacteriales bacterium]|nr:triose-phosphate isomerase [Eubacteriales bacterium]
MKPKIRTPYFETGVKNYIYGDAVLEYAVAADAASIKHDVDVLFIAPYTEIRRIREHTKKLIVLAPYMDVLRPGRGLADVLPEALAAAGAQGVVLNHCERPMTLSHIRQAVERARDLDMLSFVCADTIAEAQAVAHFHPDIINPEPTELIGGTAASDMRYVKEAIQAVKAIDPNILVEQAAGITTAQQIYDFIMAGSEAAGSASGILRSPHPYELLDEMVLYTKKAGEALARQSKA